jgi:archaemetzincin
LISYFYGLKIRLIEISYNFNGVNVKNDDDKKMQINSEQLMNILSNELPNDAFCLIGLIDTDLYIESINKNGKNIFKNTFGSKNISKKTSKNCVFFSCVMNGHNSLNEFDNKPIELCPICLRKLITNINSKGKDISNSRMKNATVVLIDLLN